MTTLGRAASVSLLALLEACTFTFDRALAPGELRGSVVYLSTTGSEVPAAGAHVVLEETSLTLTADSNGRFVFANLPAGTYALTITASTTASGAVDTGIRLQNLTLAALSGGEASGLDLGTIQLAAFGGIAGSVTVNGTGTAGASAILVDIAEAAVTPTGFDFQNLPEGDYELVVLAPGSDGTVLATTGQTVQVSPRQTTQLGTIALTSSDLALSGALQGAVTVEGSGNQTVTIQISSASNPDVATLTSNAQGEYSTPALPPGVYTVTASAPGYQPVSVPYVVVTGMTTTVPRILLSLMASASADAGTNPDGGADDAGPDGGPADAGLPDAGSRDAGSSDAGTLDAGSRDAGMVDAGPSDGGVFDGGALDAGPDAGPSDAGSGDAGSIDAGSIDAGSVDAGASDAGGGVVDAGFPDAGPSDSGVADAGPPPACVIGGTIQGASGRVSLEENGAGQIAPGNGPFYFPGDVSNGSSYSVTVVGSPSGQTCSVQHGSGFAFQNVTTISVLCETNPGSGCLQDSDCGYEQMCFNGTCAEEALNATGGACTASACAAVECVGTFSQATCATAGCQASLSSPDPTGSVACNPSFSVGGTVNGLDLGPLVLQAGTESVSISGNGPFVLPSPFPYGANDAVTIESQPQGQVCTVSQPPGNVTGNVSISVSCVEQYSITLAVNGVIGTVVITDGTDSLPISSDGSYPFPTLLDGGSMYAVSVTTQPSGQQCTVTPDSGPLTGNVTLTVSCAALYSIGGQVSGLTGSLGLTDGLETLPVTMNGSFAFTTPLLSGTPYDITVVSEPSGELCTVSNGTSPGIMGDVTTVSISCVSAFTIGGSIAGLTGTLVLTDNGGDTLSVSADGPFSFPTPVAISGAYSVAISAQPAGESCIVANSSGTNVQSNVTTVAVTCGVLIGGTVTGYQGAVPIQVLSATYGGNCGAAAGNATSSVGMTCNGGQSCSYIVSTGVLGDPAGGCGKAFAVSWYCGSFADPFQASIPAEANGQSVTLQCPDLVLQDNGVDNLPVTSSGPFTFPTGITGGGSYSASVLTQPPGQLCTVSNGSGTNVSGNVSNIGVACTNYYSVGGTLAGLPAEPAITIVSGTYGENCGVPIGNVTTQLTTACNGMLGTCEYAINNLGDPAGGCAKDYVAVWTCAGYGLVYQAVVPGEAAGQRVPISCPDLILQDNLGDNLTPSADGPFTFFTELPPGSGYSVTIEQQPDGQTCVVTNGSGSSTTNVTDVSVSCQGFATVGGSLSGFNGTPLVNVVAGTFGGNCGAPAGNATTALSAACPGVSSCALSTGTLPDAAPDCSKNFVAQWTCGVGTHVYEDILPPGGGVAQLSCSPLVIEDNNDDSLTNIADGPFTFAAQVGPGTSYDVTISSQPADQNCSITNGSGPMTQSPVADVEVTCVDLYNIGGAVSGLSGTVVLTDNGGDALTLGGNGPFQFPTELLNGDPYAVAVATQPAAQTCTVTGGSGNVTAGDVTTVAVSCQ